VRRTLGINVEKICWKTRVYRKPSYCIRISMTTFYHVSSRSRFKGLSGGGRGVNPCLFSRATNNFLLAGDRRGSLLRYGTHADKPFRVKTSKSNMKSAQFFRLLTIQRLDIISTAVRKVTDGLRSEKVNKSDK
jgi:hypothetical protein